MNIWIINHYAIPPTQAGGTRHFNIARKLIENGHNVIIFAANFNHFSLEHITKSPENLYQPCTINGVNFVWIPTNSYHNNGIKRLLNILLFSFRILKVKYRKKFNKPDFIIGSSPHPFAALSALMLANSYSAQFIFEIRDLWPESLVNLKKFSAYNPFVFVLKLIEKKLIKRAKFIISLVPHIERYLLDQGILKKNILWFPNFVNLSSLPKISYIKNNKFIFLYAGNHGLANGLNTIIEAIKILEEKGKSDRFIVQLIGDGPEKRKLIKQAKNLNLTVQFINQVPKNEIYNYIANANVCIMPLKKMSVFKNGISPNKIFDYMAMAKPIIYAVNSENNIVEEARAGISIEAENANEMADAMLKFLNMSPAQLEDMGNNARMYLEKNYDLESMIGNLEMKFNDATLITQ